MYIIRAEKERGACVDGILDTLTWLREYESEFSGRGRVQGASEKADCRENQNDLEVSVFHQDSDSTLERLKGLKWRSFKTHARCWPGCPSYKP